MPQIPAPTPAWLSTWMAASAAIFFLLMLSAPSGYSVGGGLLFLGGVAVWIATSTVGRNGVVDGAGPPMAPWTVEDRSLCWLLLAFFLTNALAVLWHGDPGKYLDQGVRYALAIPILVGLRRSDLRLDWIWAGLALGLVGAAGIAWWQTVHIGVLRADGFLTSAIPFGDIALLMTAWCVLGGVLAGRHRRYAQTVLLMVGAVAGFYAFMASATRGALIAIPLLAAIIAIAWYQKGRGRIFLLSSAVIVLLSITLVATIEPVSRALSTRYSETMTQWDAYVREGATKTSDGSMNNIGSRLEAWKTAIGSIPERPLLGWGHSEYSHHLQDLVRDNRADPVVLELSNTHNNFIEIWLHQGTLGLFAFLALMISSFWYFCRRLRAPDLTVRVLACCGASLPAAFGAFGLTQVILGRNNGVMFFVLSLTILWAAMRQAEARAVERR